MDRDYYWRFVPASDTSLPRFRTLLYLPGTVLVALIIAIFATPTLSIRNVSALAIAGFICIGIFLWVVKSASRGVLCLIFVLLGAHATIGYLIAPSSVPWIVTGNLDERAFSLSFAVIASGLMVAGYSYRLSAPSKGWLPRINTQRLARLAMCMTVIAIVAMFYLYHRNRLLPWQIDIRSLTDLRFRISGLDEWLINRSTEILMITVPLLFIFGGAARAFSLVGMLGLALTFKRAPILDVILVIALVHAIRTGKVKRLALAIGTSICLYMASQLVYVTLLQGEITAQDAYYATASALPEVRDLGWILWLNGPELHWGTTLIQPILPIPSVMSPWIQEHSLRGLTTKMIGYDWEEMGGLRITLAGEGYLNFGILGAMFLSALWGWGMRKVSSVVKAAGESGTPIHAYFAALLVSWMAFWLHLGGSQASGVVRASVLILALMYYICRVGGVRESGN